MKLVPEIFTNSNTLIVTQQQKLVFEDILGESDTTVVNCQCQRPKGLKSWVNNSRVTQYRVFYFILNHPHPQLRIGPMKILATNKVFLYLLGKGWKQQHGMTEINSFKYVSVSHDPVKYLSRVSRDMKKKDIFTGNNNHRRSNHPLGSWLDFRAFLS